MYISILDYSRGTVYIIYDTENVTENMQQQHYQPWGVEQATHTKQQYHG